MAIALTNPNFNPLKPQTWVPNPDGSFGDEYSTPEGDKVLENGIQPITYLPGMAGLANIGKGISNAVITNRILANQANRNKADIAGNAALYGGGTPAPAPARTGGIGLTAPTAQAAPAQPATTQVAYASAPSARPAIDGGGAGTPTTATNAAPSASAPGGMAMTTPGAKPEPVSQANPAPEPAAPSDVAQAAPKLSSGIGLNAPPAPGAPVVPQTSVPQTLAPDQRHDAISEQLATIDAQLANAQRATANASPAVRANAVAEVNRLRAEHDRYFAMKIGREDPTEILKQRTGEMDLVSKEYALKKQQRDDALSQQFADRLMKRGSPQAPGIAPAGPSSAGAPAPSGTPSAPAVPAAQMQGSAGLPAGTIAGGMQANSDFMPQFVPQTEEDQTAKDMMVLGGLNGNRALEMAGKNFLDYSPSAISNKVESEGLGKQRDQRSEARRAGAQVLKSYAVLKDRFDNTSDDELNGAIGPYATKKIGPPGSIINPLNWPALAMRPNNIDDMTPPEAAAAYPHNPTTALYGNAKSWDAQNEFGHLTHGITNAMMANAGKSLNMSDKRQESFDTTMRDFMGATGRDKANVILEHAKNVISNDFGLKPEEADQVIAQHLHQIKSDKMQTMPLDQLSKIDPKSLSNEQLKIAHDRMEAGR